MTPEALSAIAACASAVVAACALIFTAWQCIEMRTQRRETERQNRLSVRPLLVFTRVIINLEKHPVGVFITNSGLGPAIVRKISVCDRQSKKIVSGEKALKEIIEPIAAELELLSDVQQFWLDEDCGIKAGDTINILWVKAESLRHAWMVSLMARINIKLEYDSMYDEPRKPVYLHGSEDFA
jgi:hypothetical protein